MDQKSSQQSVPNIVAAVDLGSNSFHMVVAQHVDGHLQVIDRIREPVRLAAGLDKRKQLNRAAWDRALACLSRFGERLADLPIGSVRAVGTNTLRKARSSGNFLKEASSALGHPIEVIAGVEEARIIYLGVSHSLPMVDQNRLVIDIGGGSTELIIGKHFEPIRMASLYMGCVSASEQLFPGGRITHKRMDRALLAARLELRSIKHDYRRMGWQEAIGASGTIKSVGAIVDAMGWSHSEITHEALDKLAATLVDVGHIDKLTLDGLKDERRPVLAGGVSVLKAIFDELRIERMRVSDWALREGLVYDLIGRIGQEDVRERTIEAIKQRYRINTGQSSAVAATAAMILQQVSEDWELGSECKSIIGWAAQLHEIGLAIAHTQYHKHGAYLLANSDMPGFSHNEQQVLSTLVRGHRRKFPLAEFQQLPKEVRKRVKRLGVILRLAVVLHRNRTAEPPPEISLTAQGVSLQLTFPTGWLADQPLTRADLKSESRFLKSGDFHLTIK